MDGTTFSWIEHYLQRGWALVPLHHVIDGRCTCGNPTGDPDHDRRQGGKHPIRSLWQRDVVRTAEGWPVGANVGIATGTPSGFWVLDVDPDNGGDIQLDGLERNGSLPRTRTHRTGSGGWHYLWQMPDWALGCGRGRLAAGLDVRGTGGQIVAPPSVSAKGPYTVVDDVPIAAAPDWLLELIRPVEYDPGPAVEVTRGEVGGRGEAYAAGALRALVDELAGAVEGTRNATAFRVACRMAELVNAPWSGVSVEAAHTAYLTAASAAHEGGTYGFPPGEAVSVWIKAVRHVGGKAAGLPAPTHGGEAIPFDVAPAVNVSPTGADPFSDPTPMTRDAGDAPATHSAAPQVSVGTDPVMAMMAELLTAEQLRALPNPVPLLAGLLDMDTCAWLIGKPGSYKSFLSLSIACAVGSGKPWLDRPVRQGLVVYLVAEGLGGTKLRTAAHEAVHGPIEGVVFMPRPVLADERRAAGEWSVLVEMCRRLAPALIVIDTQSRVAVGLEENSNSEMMVLVNQIDRLRLATGACVLTVHHIGRSGTDARGASALDGAQGTELRCERTADLRVTVHQDKQKDSDDSAKIDAALLKVPMGHDLETGRDLSSLVVVAMSAAPLPAAPDWLVNTTANQGSIVGIAFDHYRQVGGTKPEIRATLHERLGRMPRSSFDRAWDGLVARQVLIRVSGSQRYLLASQAGPGA